MRILVVGLISLFVDLAAGLFDQTVEQIKQIQEQFLKSSNIFNGHVNEVVSIIAHIENILNDKTDIFLHQTNRLFTLFELCALLIAISIVIWVLVWTLQYLGNDWIFKLQRVIVLVIL